MPKKNEKTSGAGEIQVFELTMDNPEDQDELNRRLRKAGEPAHRPTKSKTEARKPADKSGPARRR